MNDQTQAEAPVDVSIVVNLHNEGMLLHRTLTSVIRAVEHAWANHCMIEVVLVGDRLTPITREFLSRTELTQGMSSVHEVDFGDLAESRNRGALLSKGTFVLFCDGDDLVAPEWPYRAWVAASSTGPSDVVAFHPEYIVTFDAQSILAYHVSSTDPTFNISTLAERNAWGPVILARRSVFLELPFTTASSGGFGFEDWHWLSELLACGGRVECVPRTVGFMRWKWEGSRQRDQVATHCLVRPTALLRPSRVAPTVDHRDRPVIRGQRSTTTTTHRLREAVEREGRRVVLRHPALVPYAHSTRALMRRIEHRLVGREWLGRSRERDDIPAWLVAVCREMHEIDCGIFPDDSLFREWRPWHAGQRTDFSEAYEALCRAADRDVTHVLLVPWLKRGGADAVAINYVMALDSLGYGGSTVVLATEDTLSPWSSRLPDSVCFVDLGRIVRRLNFDDAQRLLATYLVQAGPEVVHNVNSALGYAAFQRYGEALAGISRLYACAFCEDLTAEGRTVGYAFVEVPRVAERLTAILSDNARVPCRLHAMYGIPKDKMFVHRQPVEVPVGPVRPARSGHGGLRVLWTGRLDRQKRPDLLVAIAEECQDLDMEFHAYGAPLIASRREFKVPRQSNLIFHGHYEDPSFMRWSDYDVFLNTSEWDGLPNALLEAMAAGLPIVTSDVGGIADTIGEAQAGILVSPFDCVDDYVDALRQLAADETERFEMGQRGRRHIARSHSREQFVAAVQAVPGYACSTISTDVSVAQSGPKQGSLGRAVTSDPTVAF